MHKRHIRPDGRAIQIGVMAFVVLLTICSLALDLPAATAESHPLGFRLPNNTASAEPITIAGVQVSALEATGCLSELNKMLRTSLVTDNTCAIYLTKSGEELTILNDKRILRGPIPQPCGSPTIKLGSQDFVKVYKGLQPRTPQAKTPRGRQEKECELTGQLCVSQEGVSFELDCEDKGSVTVSTEGTVTLSTRHGKVTFEISHE